MNDRELLELAAKAVGYMNVFVCDAAGVELESWWRPLTDDGDALRLAVQLDIHIKRYAGSTTAQELCSAKSLTEHDHWSINNNDAMASTRRAIVRAAAVIGEDME